MQRSAACSEQLHCDLYIPEPQFDQFQSEGTSWVQTSLTAAGGFAVAHTDDHALHLPCVSSCDVVTRLMVFLRLFFHSSSDGCCYGEVSREWEEVISVVVSETPAILLMSETKLSSQPEKAPTALPWDLIPGALSLIQKVAGESCAG